jgi:hypothetical protein
MPSGENGLKCSRDRRDQLTHPPYQKPELLATYFRVLGVSSAPVKDKVAKSSRLRHAIDFLIALHSPDGVDETGLGIRPPEKRRQRQACNLLRTFSRVRFAGQRSRNPGIFRLFRGGRCGFLCTSDSMAEREGFEPPVPFRARRFSRPEPSTTRPPLRLLQFYYTLNFTAEPADTGSTALFECRYTRFRSALTPAHTHGTLILRRPKPLTAKTAGPTPCRSRSYPF